MSDFGACNFGAISPELIFRTLVSGIQNAGSCGIRMHGVDTSALTLTQPVYCGTPEDFWSLLHQTLIISHDGKVAIRTNFVTALDGAGLDTCGNCGDGYLLHETMSAIFSRDENGVVYLNVINITT